MPRDETEWWFPAAEAAFKRLESDFGFRIVERHYHFKGNYIRYERPDALFIVESGSDWNALSGDLAIGPRGRRAIATIASTLGAIDPTIDWDYPSTSGPLDRTAMVAAMELWANGIATHLPTLLKMHRLTDGADGAD